jgi:hypothetical protein
MNLFHVVKPYGLKKFIQQYILPEDGLLLDWNMSQWK